LKRKEASKNQGPPMTEGSLSLRIQRESSGETYHTIFSTMQRGNEGKKPTGRQRNANGGRKENRALFRRQSGEDRCEKFLRRDETADKCRVGSVSGGKNFAARKWGGYSEESGGSRSVACGIDEVHRTGALTGLPVRPT